MNITWFSNTVDMNGTLMLTRLDTLECCHYIFSAWILSLLDMVLLTKHD